MKTKRKMLLFLNFMLLFSSTPCIIHAEENPSQTPVAEQGITSKVESMTVTGYTVSKSTIQKDDLATVHVSVQQVGGTEDINVQKLEDSFSGGNIFINITSHEQNVLTYDITFTDLTYSGSGHVLRFMCTNSGSSESLEVSIAETQEYKEKTQDTPSETDNTDSSVTNIPAPAASEGISSESANLSLYTTNASEGVASENTNTVSNTSDTSSGNTIDSATPNVIISDYSYGQSEMASGGKFPLTFILKNTGKLAIENMVVSIDGGENFTVDGGTNTLYFTGIPAGGTQAVSFNMQALGATKTGAQNIGVTCKYEYVDSSKRSNSSADIKISVPVSQPDRFQVSEPTIPKNITVGEEITLSLPYINKGKENVSNVETQIEGDIETLTKTQYLGNFESGKSGSIGFVFTPTKVGVSKVVLKINYEDTNAQTKTLEFPITLNVQKAQKKQAVSNKVTEKSKSGSKLLTIVKIIIATLIASISFLFYKKRKNLAFDDEIDETDWYNQNEDAWDDDDIESYDLFDTMEDQDNEEE